MIYYNIKDEIDKLEEQESKVYLYLYEEFGFEIGFGKGGKYDGHSHLYFHDILFSQQKIITSNFDNSTISEKLIVAPSNTYIGNVVIKDFFFVKFCTTNRKVIFPEKTNMKLRKGEIFSTSKPTSHIFDWYDSKHNKSYLKLTLFKTNLLLNFGDNLIFNIS